jgi:hypothetical protein
MPPAVRSGKTATEHEHDIPLPAIIRQVHCLAGYVRQGEIWSHFAAFHVISCLPFIIHNFSIAGKS